jgi:cytochrome c-type biogenesis protein CcmH/NrfG
MKSESVVYAIAGTLFGFIVGWIVGTQQAPGHVAAGVPAAMTAAAPASAPAPSGAMPPASQPMLDEAQVTAMRNVADRDPKNVESRVHLGNLYFDAERYQDAIKWYEEALVLKPNDADVSTDLAICFYYTSQLDKAITQFEQSLKSNPSHVKTYLNMGVVKNFGKQDVAGARAAWQKVLSLAPGTQEAQTAQRFLDSVAGK